MPLALYDLPNWLFGLLISGGWILIGLGGYLAFQRLCRVTFAEAERNLAIALLGVIATINSLLLAFSAISVWESFGSAEKAVRNEAVVMTALARDLAVYDSVQSRQARDLLRTYAGVVVDQEWAAMRKGEFPEQARDLLDDMFRAIGRIDPVGPREAALMPEIWARTNELIRARRERTQASEAQVPATLWSVVVLATMLTLLTTYVLPRSAFNLSAVALLSGVFGLVFFFIAAMDRPFAGSESIGPEPIQRTMQTMARWAAQAQGLPSGPAATK
ncbi:bestrophin-like domain [Rhizobacter sp. P5_C2]